jgi:hypothetical protein
MDYAQLFQVLDSREYLLEEFTSLFLLEFSVLYNIIKEFSTAGVLHDQVKLLWSFDYFIKLYDIRMSYQF